MKLNVRKAVKGDKTPYTEFCQNSDLVPHQSFVLEQSVLSSPLSTDLLKSVLLKNFWIRHCNGYTLQQITKISKIIKKISMTDNSARIFFVIFATYCPEEFILSYLILTL